ncbi:MAG: sigma-70 family RNA polymerase sigma factor [Planctomycetales bacterium]|nr:sigma-70 family RNA polymerase sigma factor [Planctomycetales bacterium]
MTNFDQSTDQLLRRIAADDSAAVSELLTLCRPRIRQTVAVRMDRRMASRVDPSDIVQETLTEAANRIREYVQVRPVQFFPWLRSIAMNRLVDHHRRHIGAQRRSVLREQPVQALPLPDESETDLVRRLADAHRSGPSGHLERAERIRRVREALHKLPAPEREVLILKYLEQLNAAEIAAVLGIGERTVWRRHARAVESLATQLEPDA